MTFRGLRGRVRRLQAGGPCPGCSAPPSVPVVQTVHVQTPAPPAGDGMVNPVCRCRRCGRVLPIVGIRIIAPAGELP